MTDEILELLKKEKFFFEKDEEYNELLVCFYLGDIKHRYFLSYDLSKKEKLLEIIKNMDYIQTIEDISIIYDKEKIQNISLEQKKLLINLWIESCHKDFAKNLLEILHKIYETL